MSTVPDSASDCVHVYKIVPYAVPAQLPGALPLSDLDKNDGYIHLSTYDQVPDTASRFYSSHDRLWILKLKIETFSSKTSEPCQHGRLVWEQAGSHGIFPHLYDGDLGRNVVEDVLVMERNAEQDWKDVLDRLAP